MSSESRRRRNDGGAWVLRGLAAAGVLMSADVHLELYINEGFKDIDVVGPLFALNAAAGLVLGIAVLVWRSVLPLVAVAGFAAMTLGAFYWSTLPGGFFGVHETMTGTAQIVAAASEWLALLMSLAAIVIERRRTRT